MLINLAESSHESRFRLTGKFDLKQMEASSDNGAKYSDDGISLME